MERPRVRTAPSSILRFEGDAWAGPAAAASATPQAPAAAVVAAAENKIINMRQTAVWLLD